MSIYRPSSQRRVLLAVLLLASVTVITLDSRSSGGVFSGARGAMGQILSPVRRGSAAVIHPVTSFLSGLVRSGSIRAENERLRSENAELRGKLDQASIDKAHLRQLETINGLPLPPDIPTVGARAFPLANTFEWAIEIDVGSEKGLSVGNPVVSGEGLVGKVVTVRRGSAVVQLLTDPDFRVGANLAGEKGLASGHGSAPMTLELIDPQVPARKGDRVVTLGGPSSGFPPNLPIGAVRETAPPDSALQRTIQVDPVTRSTNLDFVKVLIYSGEKTS